MFSRQLTITGRVARRSFATSSAVRADKPLSESVKETVQEVANKFKNTGSIGSKFEKGGDVAETAEEVGGPFSSKGAVGKQFSAEEGGAVGSTGQKVAEKADAKATLEKKF